MTALAGRIIHQVSTGRRHWTDDASVFVKRYPEHPGREHVAACYLNALGLPTPLPATAPVLNDSGMWELRFPILGGAVANPTDFHDVVEVLALLWSQPVPSWAPRHGSHAFTRRTRLSSPRDDEDLAPIVDELRASIPDHPKVRVLTHGDAHQGNFMRDALGRMNIIDVEHLCSGWRELDAAKLVHGALFADHELPVQLLDALENANVDLNLTWKFLGVHAARTEAVTRETGRPRSAGIELAAATLRNSPWVLPETM